MAETSVGLKLFSCGAKHQAHKQLFDIRGLCSGSGPCTAWHLQPTSESDFDSNSSSCRAGSGYSCSSSSLLICKHCQAHSCTHGRLPHMQNAVLGPSWGTDDVCGICAMANTASSGQPGSVPSVASNAQGQSATAQQTSSFGASSTLMRHRPRWMLLEGRPAQSTQTPAVSACDSRFITVLKTAKSRSSTGQRCTHCIWAVPCMSAEHFKRTNQVQLEAASAKRKVLFLPRVRSSPTCLRSLAASVMLLKKKVCSDTPLMPKVLLMDPTPATGMLDLS